MGRRFRDRGPDEGRADAAFGPDIAFGEPELGGRLGHAEPLLDPLGTLVNVAQRPLRGSGSPLECIESRVLSRLLMGVAWRFQGRYRYSRRPLVRGSSPTASTEKIMANIASQKKRILRTERERVENRRLTSAIKTYFHRLETAVGEGDADTVETEHRALVSKIDKAVQRGAIHRRNGARTKSRAARVASGAVDLDA